MIGFPEGLILMFSLIPMLIGLALTIYLITLLSRLVRAVERIADKVEK